jgi:GntR family transcriptional regulator/MocR family aminotransferase
MRSWELAVTLDEGAAAPVFLQIARAIADDVRRGRLRPGDALPGSRSLARSLGVHRNTVLAAYRELDAEGWITSEPAGGTFVSTALPDPRPRAVIATRAAVPERLGFALAPAPEWPPSPRPYPRGALPLSDGSPDLRLVPTAELARAYRRVLRARGREVLGYGDPAGHPRLRAALAEMLSALRGVAAAPESLLVTRGSQQAIDLVARALLAPGDVVAVEALGYRPAWAALAASGARLVPLPVDDEGLRVEALRELCAKGPVRALYVTPHHQYPTTATLAPGRRIELLAFARAQKIAILEDDYDFEFHFEGRPILPLASADGAGVVVYIGTLSKILAPGLRIGFVVAPPPLVERLAGLRRFCDRQGDLAVELAVAELLEEGEVQRHARRVKRVYAGRRAALAAALRAQLDGALSFTLPAGGMALWVRVAESIDVDAWAERAVERGVVFYPGQRYAFDGRARPFTRLTFALLDEGELREGVRRLAAAL